MTVTSSDQYAKIVVIRNCIDSITQTNLKLISEINQAIRLQHEHSNSLQLNTDSPKPKRKRNSSVPPARILTKTRLFCQEI